MVDDILSVRQNNNNKGHFKGHWQVKEVVFNNGKCVVYSDMQTRTKTGSLTKIEYQELQPKLQKEGTSTDSKVFKAQMGPPKKFYYLIAMWARLIERYLQKYDGGL